MKSEDYWRGWNDALEEAMEADDSSGEGEMLDRDGYPIPCLSMEAWMSLFRRNPFYKEGSE